MTDILLRIGLSNAFFSLALAIVAMVVGKTAKRPHLAHLLWLLVFVKLVTPPVLSIPVFTLPASMLSDGVIMDYTAVIAQPPQLEVGNSPVASSWSMIWDYGKAGLPTIWLVGCMFVLIWSLIRVWRFNQLLVAESIIGTGELQSAAAQIASKYGLKSAPDIYTTSARLSPMVWWIGGKVRIVIPSAMLEQMESRQWKWVLAHELAHVRRRDYLVRWLEWLACVCFWWNPVVWWAQRNLRSLEEICCDALVMSCLKPKPQTYANSLLTAVEFLAHPVIRPPAMASEINSGGYLERRFKMIIANNPNHSKSRWLQAFVLLCAVVVLPLGVTYAQDYDAVHKRLTKAVKKGELTLEQAGAMMKTLREVSEKDNDQFENLKTDYQAFERRIKAAVQMSKVTREEAWEKLEGYKKRLGMAEKLEKYRAVEAELREAVEAGNISGEDAEKRLIGARMHIFDKKRSHEERDLRGEYRAFELRMREAVETGKISGEDAREKLAAFRKRLEMTKRLGDDHADDKANLEAIWKRLQKGVKQGKLTQEEAEARMSAIKKEAVEKKGRGEHKERLRRKVGRDELDWDAIKRRIEGAVESGKITREEADAKYQELRTQH